MLLQIGYANVANMAIPTILRSCQLVSQCVYGSHGTPTMHQCRLTSACRARLESCHPEPQRQNLNACVMTLLKCTKLAAEYVQASIKSFQLCQERT